MIQHSWFWWEPSRPIYGLYAKDGNARISGRSRLMTAY
jgi:hypothetical protein